ncbi:MAG TPA: hypothetical protein VLL69_23145 [Streptosporangiaceae bacterium]|nr:hypothetical protein [Streptosporangiaceae bacterium]
MGEVAGAGLLAHVPTIMLPYEQRLELNEGKEISLVTGLQRLRAEVFEALDYDTVVVLDSHWHTTVEFVVAAQQMRAGLFTSDELPRGMCRIPYEWHGDPGLAQAIAGQGDRHGTWITAIDDPLPAGSLRHRQPVALPRPRAGQAVDLDEHRADRRHRGLPARGPGARRRHSAKRPGGAAGRVRGHVAHVLVAAGAAGA